MTTAQLWRKLMAQIGWRVTCPACGKVHDIPTRERFISSLYYAAVPMVLSLILFSCVDVAADRLQRGLVLAGPFVVFLLLGSWFAARRLRLG